MPKFRDVKMQLLFIAMTLQCRLGKSGYLDSNAHSSISTQVALDTSLSLHLLAAPLHTRGSDFTYIILLC